MNIEAIRTFVNDDIFQVKNNVERIVEELTSRRIDITQGYEAWRNIGFALAEGLGEGGRQFFHQVSSMNDAYDECECDKQYAACLNAKGSGITIATFYHMAKEAGVAICAKSAKVPLGTNGAKERKMLPEGYFDGENASGTLAQVAQMAQSEVGIHGQNTALTFCDKLCLEDLPLFLQPLVEREQAYSDKDKQLLGALATLSGLLPESLYALYDERKVYPPLYVFVHGPFASGKGDLEVCRQLAYDVKAEMAATYREQLSAYEAEMAEWEVKDKKVRGVAPKEPVRQSPFIAANSSTSALLRHLDANEGWGVIFETEADTLTNILNQKDYGDYTDILRKAHHHEELAMTRVGEHLDIHIEHPRLAVFLCGTNSQLTRLFPADNVNNGLLSRFLLYGLTDKPVAFRDVFAHRETTIEDLYRDMGRKYIVLHHELQARKERPIQFVLSDMQKQQFRQHFSGMLEEECDVMGKGIQGFIYRLALECMRIAMILSALRRLDKWDSEEALFHESEQALVCDERDFHTAVTIIECLLKHTKRVYDIVATQESDPFAKFTEKCPKNLKTFFNALPATGVFTTKEAMEIARNLNLAERSAKRYLTTLVAHFNLLNQPKGGSYEKFSPQETDVKDAE